MAQTITLTNEQIEKNPFVTKDKELAFYNLIEKLCEKTNHKITRIDCTKINVAKNIQDSWYTYAKNNNIDTKALTMSLAFAGPKALYRIPENTVEILDECIRYEKCQ